MARHEVGSNELNPADCVHRAYMTAWRGEAATCRRQDQDGVQPHARLSAVLSSWLLERGADRYDSEAML